MEVRRYDDPAAFADRAMPRLLSDPGRHSLCFGIVHTLQRDPSVYRSFVLLAAEEDDAVRGLAIRTAPFGVVIARPDTDEALVALADAAVELAPDAPGVVGARPEADAFAARWIERRGGSLAIENRQGLFELRAVRERGDAPGEMRTARDDDLPLLIAWTDAFMREAVPGHPADEATRHRQIERIHADGGFRLWEVEGRAVSLTGVHAAPPVGARIGPVYTPTDERAHGYATALVAAASEEQLAAGRSACFLSTDLANPTSNAIYRRIGYDWVCEAIDLRFRP
jgi:GNAT superfamily N-acetyltransferase